MRIGDCSSDVCSSDLFQSTIGQPKVDVVSRMARDINPDLDINNFPDGVTLDNMEQFLSGVDLYVDGLDFFVLDIRARLFALARKSVVQGTSVSVRVAYGGGRIIKKKIKKMKDN